MPFAIRGLLERALVQAFAFAVCVVVPALATWMAPLSITDLSRQGPVVSAKVTTCIFFCISIREVVVSPVKSVASELHPGQTYTESVTQSDGRRKRETRRSEDEAFLALIGDDQRVLVPVSPVNVEQVKRRVAGFLTAAEPDELRLRTVANWKFSVLAGVPLTLLTLLYVVGWSLQAIRWPLRVLRGPPA